MLLSQSLRSQKAHSQTSTQLQDIELRVHQPLPTPEEAGVCLGSNFTVEATNGDNPSRRLGLVVRLYHPFTGHLYNRCYTAYCKYNFAKIMQK